ncbi:MAG TPA: MBL fold metallo-hydrolase [Rhodanobacteraceae bacterium]|nr:MBL fold metallo-hydrolase [Rhodanobacteraceae bacterium]
MNASNEPASGLPICENCGTQFAALPTRCPTCADNRVSPDNHGQRWTTHAALARRFRLRVGEDAGLLAFAIDGDFAIGQRVLHVPTTAGNILWECVSLVTDEAVQALQEAGGVDRIVISHPHFYTSMVEWSEALGGVEILLHEADRQWVARPFPRIRFWRGDTLRLSDDVTLINTSGHFPGSTVLHWADGPRGGALLSGDSPQVAKDGRRVGFMYSYPNSIPMALADVRRMREVLHPFDYDDVYGYSWGRNILGGGRAAVDASFEDVLRIAAA